MKFILNRTNDWATMPKKKIFLYALIWCIAFKAIAGVLFAVCISIYNSMGIDPTQLTQFGGDPTTHIGKPLVRTILLMVLIAPIAEETMFRLGLSFKRMTVAVWGGLLPIVTAAYLFQCRNWFILSTMALSGLILFWLIMRYTSEEQWECWKLRYLRLGMWISSISFFLIHLKAFSVITWGLLPYCLVFCLSPGLLGCVFTYARVNMGFWWGVLFHLLNNLPGALILLSLSNP